MAVPGYWATDDDDPRRVHHNVLVALDEAREVNNGQPSLWAFLFEQLGIRPGERVRHLGCGTGYYIAVAAELVGPHGALTTDSGPGAMLLVTRQGPEAFAARFLCMAQFIDFQGARDSGASRSLLSAFRRTGRWRRGGPIPAPAPR